MPFNPIALFWAILLSPIFAIVFSFFLLALGVIQLIFIPAALYLHYKKKLEHG